MGASLEAEYGINLTSALEDRSIRLTDLAGRVMWLPPGSAFWRSYGGPMALSAETQAIEHAAYTAVLIAWQQGGGKGAKPKPHGPPPYAHEQRESSSRTAEKAAAIVRLRERRNQ